MIDWHLNEMLKFSKTVSEFLVGWKEGFLGAVNLKESKWHQNVWWET